MKCFRPLIMALLVNSADRNLAQAQVREVLCAASNLGLELHVLNAANDGLFPLVRQRHIVGDQYMQPVIHADAEAGGIGTGAAFR